MRMDVRFRTAQPSDRGILRSLLIRSYQPLKDLNEAPWVPSEAMWWEYDDYVFDHREQLDGTILLTEVDETVVGFCTFAVRGGRGSHHRAQLRVARGVARAWGRGRSTRSCGAVSPWA